MLDTMIETINKVKPPRLTALKELQQEESGDPLQILIGTILSARTRDENTTIAVRKLFTKYKTVEQLAKANTKEIQKLIKSTGFYHVKAKRIKDVANMLIEKHAGRVPDNIDELLSLPGVGRKTANCVLVYAFNRPAVPVDTHVHRISNRLGLVETKTPEQTELELTSKIDKKYWTKINDTFVMFGQNICKPVGPLCEPCLLKRSCKYYRQLKSSSLA
ncbi:MAG TPA: endonuclease III, partial [Nitrososphaerales archaeon]|nr:endonuclease III [Nitrososphaerales archaeon]